jgi:hypothetical protein
VLAGTTGRFVQYMGFLQDLESMAMTGQPSQVPVTIAAAAAPSLSNCDLKRQLISDSHSGLCKGSVSLVALLQCHALLAQQPAM